MKPWIKYALLIIMVSLIATLGLFYYLWPAAEDIVVENRQVILQEWAADAKPVRMVLLSDAHLAHWDEDYLRAIIEKTLASKPDLVIMLGDYLSAISASQSMVHRQIADMHQALAQACPVYYVMGNHDDVDMKNSRSLKKQFNRVGFHDLENKKLSFTVDGKQSLCLAGLPFSHKKLSRKKMEELKKLEAQPIPLIIACHTPWPFQKEEDLVMDLGVAGHTHGGQLCYPDGTPLVSFAGYEKKNLQAGMKRSLTGRPYYISRGLGTSRIPVRINCPPEITVLELRGHADTGAKMAP